MDMVVKGLITGCIIVLPGMSGGTMLLLLGLYERLMQDLARLRVLPWIPFVLGAGAGIVLSGKVFAWLLAAYSSIVSAFLLGCILASVKAVLGEHYKPTFRRAAALLIGLAVGLILSDGQLDLDTAMSLPPSPPFLLAGYCPVPP